MRDVIQGVGLLLLGSGCHSAPAPRPVEPERPNVLILFTDDQRHDTIHALGNAELRTPGLDRLVETGLSFRRAHIMGGLHGAICAPSRAMLLSGRHLFGLQQQGDVIPAEHPTMPEVFGAAGYDTFATGKWHNDRASFQRSFQDGRHLFFGGMHFEEDGGHEAPWLHDHEREGRYERASRRQHQGFSSEAFADAAIAFLESRREAADPFFAYVSFSSPHDPRTPPPPFDGWYDPDELPLPASFLPEHPFDNGELRVRDELLCAFPRTPEMVRAELASYYGMISEVDHQIGRILDALERAGLAERTLVVFAGDNGLAVGNHGLMGKQSLYEHSIRVPLLLRGPGVPAGERREALVLLHDLFPTIAELCGVPIPASVQGRSLVPTLAGEVAVRDGVYAAYRDLQRAVSDGRWKLIEYHVDGRRRSQLFDLQQDPHETADRAADPGCADILTSLRQRLRSEARRLDDPLDPSLSDWGKPPPERPAAIEHRAIGARVVEATRASDTYPGGGPAALVDGLRGVSDHAHPSWQGFEAEDVALCIELAEVQELEEIGLGFLRRPGSWIFAPRELELTLEDGRGTETALPALRLPPPTESDPAGLDQLLCSFDPTPVRRVHLRITAQKVCPPWHRGEGGKAWLFLDEVWLR